MKKYEELAKNIIDKVGGEKNVRSLTHCVTRLRFQLFDEKKAATADLKNMDGVVTVVQSGGQYQVVIGSGVGDVYDTVLEVSDIKGSAAFDEDGGMEESGNLFDRFINMVSSIFSPVLGVLMASGMIKGFTALFVAFDLLDAKSGTCQVLQIVGDAFFYFLPIFLGLTAARKFKMNEFTGMAVAAALVYPSMATILKGDTLYQVLSGTLLATDVKLEFLGMPVLLMNYASSVIPIIIAVYFGAKIEHALGKIIPSMFKGFLVPFFSLLFIIPLTLLAIGPVATWLGKFVGAAAMSIYNLSPVLAGLFIGGLWQVFVMFGLHWGVTPILFNNFAVFGYDPVFVTYFGATFAQTGVVLAILLRTKNKKLRSLALPAFFSGIFGVTEPAIYGITLPRKKYFIISCIGAAIGGAIIAFYGVKLYFFGGLGIFGYPTFIDPATSEVAGMYHGILASIIAFLVGFGITLPIYKDQGKDAMSHENDANEEVNSDFEVKDIAAEMIVAPLKGKVLPLAKVEDPIFASGAVGKGVAIDPEDGRIVAPADGTVTNVFPTGHAVGITTNGGAEILIHIGMDTVKLEGKYFHIKTKQGDKVQKGDILIEFDRENIVAAGYPVVTPIVITNYTQYKDIIPTADSIVQEGDDLLALA